MTNPNSHQVAIITGSSSGIGKATALVFAKNGYRLSLSGRNEANLSQTMEECIAAGLPQDYIITTVGDLCEEEMAKVLINRTIDKFGQIDVLVNALGILVTGGVGETPLKELDRIMDVNVRSVVSLTKLAIPHLQKAKGAIVNVSSIAGTHAFPAVSYYCMSKAALDQFTKCLALELAPQGVRVNAVNPGVIVTDIHRRAGMGEQAYQEFLKKGEQTHPLGRVGSGEEVARGILYLARDATFTTGQLLHIDGGRSLMTPR